MAWHFSNGPPEDPRKRRPSFRLEHRYPVPSPFFSTPPSWTVTSKDISSNIWNDRKYHPHEGTLPFPFFHRRIESFRSSDSQLIKGKRKKKTACREAATSSHARAYARISENVFVEDEGGKLWIMIRTVMSLSFSLLLCVYLWRTLTDWVALTFFLLLTIEKFNQPYIQNKYFTPWNYLLNSTEFSANRILRRY